MFELHVVGTFSAAHRLRGYEGPCERLHGHNYRVLVFVRCAELDPIGLGLDFKTLKARLREVLAELDHRDLGETPFFRDLNPSAENLARHVYQRLRDRLTDTPAHLARVTVAENDDSYATYWDDGDPAGPPR